MSAGPRRPSRSRSAALYLSAALLASTAAGWYTFGGEEPSGPGAGSAAVPSWSADLPWPAEGQSSAEVEGLGSLGTRGEQTPVPIASITKVMTAYVILTHHPLSADEQGTEVTADRQAADESYSLSESTAPLVADRHYTQRQLLELMMLPSGNNVARLLARWDAGSQEEFAKKMNKAASELGMDRTIYTGASGIEASTKSTAADQLKLARAVMKNEAFRQIVATPSVTAPGTGAQIRNSNRLLGQDGVIGLKTGSSTPAGTNPTRAMTAAFDASHTLITAIRDALPQTLAAP